MKSDTKSVEYLQSRLRSASDIYKTGGHVTMVFKDQKFRMHFDNRRLLVAPIGVKEIQTLYDSLPLNGIKQGENLRFISKLSKTSEYNSFTSVSYNKTYKKQIEVPVLNFVKGLLTEPPLFNLHRVGLETYALIEEYIKTFNPGININPMKIARLKHSSLMLRTVPKTRESESFVKYLRIKFKDFDEELFYKK